MINNFRISAFADEAGSLFTEQIEAMKKNGVSCLEMRGVNGRNVSDMTKDEVKCASLMLEKEGLSVWSIGSPIGKIDIKDAFEPHLEKFKRVLDAAVISGAECVRIFSFYGVETEAQIDEALERLNRFAEISEGAGVILCHENEKGIYGWSAENCLNVLTKIPRIRAVFDPANFIQCGVDTKEAWDLLAPYVCYLHIKDAKPDGGVVPAGKGIGNLPYIVKSFADRGGKVLSLEPHLTVFKGFAELEKSNESIKESYVYKTPAEAFAAAADSLYSVINDI